MSVNNIYEECPVYETASFVLRLDQRFWDRKPEDKSP